MVHMAVYYSSFKSGIPCSCLYYIARSGYGGSFHWDDYLSKTSSAAAPHDLFTEVSLLFLLVFMYHFAAAIYVTVQAQRNRAGSSNKSIKEFKVGMKLEAKDRQYPTLTCVATIAGIRHNGHKLQIHFDDWDSSYDYWCDSDSTDIHPKGWCARHKMKLQKPKSMSCSVEGDQSL